MHFVIAVREDVAGGVVLFILVTGFVVAEKADIAFRVGNGGEAVNWVIGVAGFRSQGINLSEQVVVEIIAVLTFSLQGIGDLSRHAVFVIGIRSFVSSSIGEADKVA